MAYSNLNYDIEYFLISITYIYEDTGVISILKVSLCITLLSRDHSRHLTLTLQLQAEGFNGFYCYFYSFLLIKGD